MSNNEKLSIEGLEEYLDKLLEQEWKDRLPRLCFDNLLEWHGTENQSIDELLKLFSEQDRQTRWAFTCVIATLFAKMVKSGDLEVYQPIFEEHPNGWCYWDHIDLKLESDEDAEMYVLSCERKDRSKPPLEIHIWPRFKTGY